MRQERRNQSAPSSSTAHIFTLKEEKALDEVKEVTIILQHARFSRLVKMEVTVANRKDQDNEKQVGRTGVLQ